MAKGEYKQLELADGVSTTPATSSPIGEVDYLDLTEAVDPANPSAGIQRVYAGTDGKIYKRDSDGLEAVVGSGSGAGELNLVEDPSEANNWTVTNTAATNPMAGATTTTAGDLPLAGIIDTAIKITSRTVAGAEASEYVSYAFTTPASLASKLKVEFYQRPGANFLASEWTVSVYAGATRQSLSTDASGVTYLPNASGKFTTTFDCLAATAYTVRFARPVNAGGDAGVLNVANVILGPGIQPQGAVVGPWLSYTPTLVGFGSPTIIAAHYRRDGESMHVRVKFTSGTSTATQAQVPLPTGHTVNALGGTTQVVGRWHRDIATATTIKFGAMLALSTNVAYVTFSRDDYTAAVGPYTAGNGNVIAASGDGVGIDFFVPIAEWASSGVINLASNDVQYAWNSDVSGTASVTASGFAYGPSGVGFSASWTIGTEWIRRVRFQTPIQATDIITLEIESTASTARWVPYESRYQGFSRQGGAEYGPRLVNISATDFDVYFSGGGIYSGATYASNGAAFSGISTQKWRLKKTSGGAAVGWGAATATASGLVSREENGSFSVAITGPSSSTTTCYYSRVGKSVTLTFPDFSATSTSGTFATLALTNMPASIRPVTRTDMQVLRITNSGSTLAENGFVRVPTTDSISIYRNGTGASFAATLVYGWGGFSVSYTSA